jgi:predicted acylesterase/phospholipase RssA
MKWYTFIVAAIRRMATKTALVLSGGGMFGAWQAGAWSALAPDLAPDLVVGASAGALNGYAIASGWTPAELCDLWRHPDVAGGFRALPLLIQRLMAARPLQLPYAVVLVDLLCMKPRTVLGPEITGRHLAASCAVPGMARPQCIGGRWYVDGGLLNPLPVWAAVEWGATRIIALHALPEIPSTLLKPFVRLFRGVFGHNPVLRSDIELMTIVPGRRLGGMSDALHWKRENIERWLAQGASDAAAKKRIQENASIDKWFGG